VLTNSESDFNPFALVIFLRDFNSGTPSTPIGASRLFDSRLCWLFLWEYGRANPRFRLPVKDDGWFRVLCVRLH
jgi:hypothetical protein